MFRPFPLVAHQERMVAVAAMDTAGEADKGAAGEGYGEVALAGYAGLRTAIASLSTGSWRTASGVPH